MNRWESTSALLGAFKQQFDQALMAGSVNELRNRLDDFNQYVTMDYRLMSADMRRYQGVGNKLVDWAGFAAWVSCSLGAYLRREANNFAFSTMPRRNRIFIIRFLPRLVTIDDWVELGRANLQIYVEMRTIYDTVFALIDGGVNEDDPEVERRVDELLVGPEFGWAAADVAVTDSDHRWTLHAVRSLVEAYRTADIDQTSQLMYAANVALSAVEQRRADPQIDRFLESAVVRNARIPNVLNGPAVKVAVLAGTRLFVHFLTPDGYLAVCRSMDRPTDNRYTGDYNSLAQLTHPMAREAREEFFFNPHYWARDWSDYGQRMAFIAEYFRLYQEIPEVLAFKGLPKIGEWSPVRSSMYLGRYC